MKITERVRMNNKILKMLSIAIFASLALTACGSNSEPTPSPSATENPYGGGFTVSSPADSEVVLTIKGSTEVNYTMGELKEMASKVITINEPFVKQVQKFNVILLKDLLKGVSIPAGANLNTVALNDYAYANTANNLFVHNAYLAVLRNGEDIPMDQGGPIRIIFADNSDYATNLDAWNWSLRTIEIK